MINGKIICLSFSVCLTVALAQGQSHNETPKNKLAKEIIGEWRNESLKLKINSYNNTDSTVYSEANASNWEEKLHIKPIRTHFSADGSYYSEYRNLKDSIFRRASGAWYIKGDSIIMTQLKPDKSILRLRILINKDIATFTGLIDFDGDGKFDDEYFGTQKKFK